LIWWRGLRVESGVLGAMLLIALPLALRRALDPRPLVVINETGIDDRRLGIGTIAWRDIKRAYARSFEGATFICLELADTEAYLERMPYLTRVAGQFWRLFGIGPLHLSTAHLEMQHNELFELVMARCESAAPTQHNK
jgi:hypothetical protein